MMRGRPMASVPAASQLSPLQSVAKPGELRQPGDRPDGCRGRAQPGDEHGLLRTLPEEIPRGGHRIGHSPVRQVPEASTKTALSASSSKGRLVTQPGFEPGTYCLGVKLASSMVFSQLLPFVTFTRFWGVCFRSQRLRLARLRGEFSDGFLTVVAVTAMPYGLRSTLLQ